MGQPRVDSLKLLYAAAKERKALSRSAFLLSEIASNLSESRQYDSALSYYRQALAEVRQVTDPNIEAVILNGTGVVFSSMGILDSSMVYYNKALQLYEQLGDSTRAIVVGTNLSIVYKSKGLYEKALETAFVALTKLENRKPDRALASCYNTIGVVYEKIGDNSNALIFYYKSLSVRRAIGYERGVGQSYNNIGEAYMALARYDSAMTNFLRSLEIKRHASDRAGSASTLSNMGAVMMAQRRPQQAESYLLESLAIKKESKDQEGIATTLNTLAEAKLMTDDLTSAESYLALADPIIRQVGVLNELKRSLELKVRLYKARRDNLNAFRYAEELMVIKDSLLNHEKTEIIQNMQTRYETEKKEQQIALLEQRSLLHQTELEVKQLWIYGLAVGIVLVALAGTLFYTNLRIVREHRRRVETLLRELNHRVKNNLQILSSIFSLQVQQQTDETVLQAMKSGEGRVNAMALIHKKLYSENENLEIKIKEYVNELIAYLVHSYGFDQRTLKLSVHVEEIELDVDKVIRIGLIVNELVSNAFKYAYVSQALPLLDVRITREAKCILVEVGDNGAGMPDTFDIESAQSFGLRMIRMFVRELRGKLVVSNHAGARFTLNIPIPNN
jgi:two-component sensor histidine kinase